MSKRELIKYIIYLFIVEGLLFSLSFFTWEFVKGNNYFEYYQDDLLGFAGEAGFLLYGVFLIRLFMWLPPLFIIFHTAFKCIRIRKVAYILAINSFGNILLLALWSVILDFPELMAPPVPYITILITFISPIIIKFTGRNSFQGFCAVQSSPRSTP